MSLGIRAAAVGAGQALLRPSTQICSKCRPRPAMPRGSEMWRSRHPMQITPRFIRASSDVFAYDTATAVFTGFNTLLLFPWTLMVFVPNLDFTRSLIKSNIFLYIFCLMFIYLFAAATAEALRAGASLSDEVQFLFLEAVADPKKMAAMFSQDRPVYAAQDWAHLCTWDYFVGYWIYLQGQDKKIFTRHSLVLAFNSGPPGLISHFITEAITQALRSNTKASAETEATPQKTSAASSEQDVSAKSQE